MMKMFCFVFLVRMCHVESYESLENLNYFHSWFSIEKDKGQGHKPFKSHKVSAISCRLDIRAQKPSALCKCHSDLFLKQVTCASKDPTLINQQHRNESPDSELVSMVIKRLRVFVPSYLWSSRRRTEPWCRGSQCGWGYCTRCARQARPRHSSSSARWWGSGRCCQPASRGRTGPVRPARPGRADPQWPAGLQGSGSVWRPWLSSACLLPLSEKPHLGDETVGSEFEWKGGLCVCVSFSLDKCHKLNSW